MIENLYEQVVINENKGAQTKYSIMMVFSILFCFIGFIFAVFGLSSISNGGWIFLIPGALLLAPGIFLFIKKDEVFMEYEYDFISGKMDIAKIINNKKRKNLVTFECRDIEVIGKVTQENYPRYSSMPNAKKLFATFDRTGDNTYFALFNSTKNRILLHFSTYDELLTYMKKHLKVVIGK